MSQIRTVVVDDDKEVAGVHTGFLLAHGAFDRWAPPTPARTGWP